MQTRGSFFRPARLKHAHHAVGDEESADHIAEGSRHSYSSQRRGQRRRMPPGNDDRRHYHDGIERVGQRHQRRVQKRRDPLDQLKTHKSRQDEKVKIGHEIRWHFFLLELSSLLPVTAYCATSAGSPIPSRTRAFTTSPPCVSNVSRIISSLSGGRTFPSFTSTWRKVVRFFAYIWLA